MEVVQVYLDLPLLGGLLGWAQDTALLWLVAQISSAKTGLKELLLGGAVGGVYQFFLLVNQASGGVSFPWILAPAVFIPMPLLMSLLAFYPAGPRGYLKALGYFLLLSFLLSGIHWGLDSLNRRFFRIQFSLWPRFWLHLGLIFVLGELGWGIVHRKVWDEICLYPLEISWGDQVLNLIAFLDTGNKLRDPLTKAPVIIVELEAIKRFLPPELVEIIASVRRGEFEAINRLPTFWQERFRVLPFSSIGREEGILVGFRPDQVRVGLRRTGDFDYQAVVCFYQHRLSPEGAFQALIPSVLLSRNGEITKKAGMVEKAVIC